MTDISELVKRMRGLAEYVDDCDEAADALEAQAKEIAEKDARIAELRAALNGWQKWWGLPWQDRRPDIAERCYRAALNGEKR
jgi:hypothetical protein